jgi:GTP pyrophosphokinase
LVPLAHLKLITRPVEPRLDAWVAALGAGYGEADLARLTRVLEWVSPRAGERTLAAGEPLLSHAVNSAFILQELGLDAECVAASLLAHFAQPDALLEVRDLFGARITELAAGAARMSLIESLGSGVGRAQERSDQLEGLRKMLLAMAQDVRVVLIKLADHVQTMRFAVKSDDVDARHAMARLALDIFAPLANRLGVWQLKWELEDLALRILEPDTYKRIARLLAEKRASREQFIDAAVTLLRAELARAGIAADISGRPKHIYSIYLKMKRKGVDFDAGLRRACGARARGYDQGLLCGTQHCAQYVDTGARGIRRLHCEAEEQRLPFSAHSGDRTPG